MADVGDCLLVACSTVHLCNTLWSLRHLGLLIMYMDEISPAEFIPYLLCKLVDEIFIAGWTILMDVVGIPCLEEIELVNVSSAQR